MYPQTNQANILSAFARILRRRAHSPGKYEYPFAESRHIAKTFQLIFPKKGKRASAEADFVCASIGEVNQDISFLTSGSLESAKEKNRGDFIRSRRKKKVRAEV